MNEDVLETYIIYPRYHGIAPGHLVNGHEYRHAASVSPVSLYLVDEYPKV